MAPKKAKVQPVPAKRKTGLQYYCLLAFIFLGCVLLYYWNSNALKSRATRSEGVKIQSLEEVLFGGGSIPTNVPSTQSLPTREEVQKVKVASVSEALKSASQANIQITSNLPSVSPLETSTTQQIPSSSLIVSDQPHKAKEKISSAAPSTRAQSIRNFSIDLGPISWKQFVSLKTTIPPKKVGSVAIPDEVMICPQSVVEQLARPVLSEAEIEWCKYALDPNRGQVVVGRSYGKLNAEERKKYDNLNCNEVLKGVNPSCDDQWGDNHLISWVHNPIPKESLCTARPGGGSKVQCFDSSSKARFCTFENAMLDFKKMHHVNRPRSTPSRSWDAGFLGTDCDKSKNTNIGYYKFYDAVVEPETAQCDIHFTEPVVAYGHDNIKNLGHSMSDFMNVWTMLSLAGVDSENAIFLNIDALREGHNYNDEMGAFALHYEKSFLGVKYARDYKDKRVCFKNLIWMPRPVILFVWDGWWTDMQCSFVGPSTLFQRWNLQIRQNHGLLEESPMRSSKGDNLWNILVVFRKLRPSDGNSALYTSRVIVNQWEVVTALSKLPNVTVSGVDLANYTFADQLKLMARASIVVGAHGAGITSSMHMSVGSKRCCGVLELFPPGEFMPIRGHGNMARRMGHHYERLDLSNNEVSGKGMKVNAMVLASRVQQLMEDIEVKPTCLHPLVMKDTFFSNH